MTLHKAFDGEVYYWWDDDRQQASRVQPKERKPTVANDKDKATAKRVIKRYLDNDTNDHQLENEFIAALTTARKEAREAAFKESAQKLRNRAETWRQEGERWQQQALRDNDPKFRAQCYVDRDTCLAKMAGALVLAAEFNNGDEGNNGRGI